MGLISSKSFLNIKTYVVLVSALAFMSFKSDVKKISQFNYPKREGTSFTIKTDLFDKFTEEWRDKDYYYYAENKNGFICSVYYFKLNKDEQKMYVDLFGGMTSAAMSFTYFSEYSNLKPLAKNTKNWGKMDDDFMFQQYDIKDIGKTAFSQKHIYGYCMFDKDLFVNIHLSKANCTSQDSVGMMEILNSLTKAK